MTLTEQWKKGELEFGKEYYVHFEDGEIDTAQWCYYTNQNKYGFDVDEVKEVLAPVPSYEEWKSMGKFAMEAMKVAEENQQLKELIKECYKMLAQYHVENSEPSLDENIELLTKIDNAIGEKK